MVSNNLTRHATMLNQDGFTALILASFGGYESVVTLLLDAKADVNSASLVREIYLT